MLSYDVAKYILFLSLKIHPRHQPYMKIAVCCAMNQNRSMEAHRQLKAKGYDVKSYGVNKYIKIPGETLEAPNIYSYENTYEDIYNDLTTKNHKYYKKIGILEMIERNMKIKERPEHFFDTNEIFDIVITAEEKCFYSIFEKYSGTGNNYTWLVNFDIKDTIKDSERGGKMICEFIDTINKIENEVFIGKRIERGIEIFSRENAVNMLFSIIKM